MPFKSDFVKIYSINPKEIHGVNSTSIPTIGIGVIIVRCGNGRRFILNDALFAPQVALHLISSGRLRDEGFQVVFEASCCQVLKNRKILAKGTSKGRHLYHLHCDTPHFKWAVIACTTPTLKTWHW